jgi:hypothetical protein
MQMLSCFSKELVCWITDTPFLSCCCCWFGSDWEGTPEKYNITLDEGFTLPIVRFDYLLLFNNLADILIQSHLH